ncbi:helix-turn-helix domain-containing protein [Caldicellulosiruptor morganii]|uniref:Helix-turn-helix transcriptional regulator n=1 Tax=Caldicellulosiruptor morganii TaxID=1387555 RepID=A0ABY7BMI7_9FIRM|nr:helix-turn-helix transcriptional regulator [Caldicellulosiruptor morganii]WAM33266.1 helix-turn-helix transcriptional regulator [Caldicellulosiruptor morganii]
MNLFRFRLKELREEKNISRNDLAEILGVSTQTIANYENGHREPNFDTLLKIADFFGVTVDYLIGHSDFRTREEEFKGKNFYEKYKLDEVIEVSLDSESKAILGNILVNNVEPLIRNISGILYQHTFGDEKKDFFTLFKKLLDSLNLYFGSLLEYTKKPAYFLALKSDYDPSYALKLLFERYGFNNVVSNYKRNSFMFEKKMDDETITKIISELQETSLFLISLLKPQGEVLTSMRNIEAFYLNNFEENLVRILKLIGAVQGIVDISEISNIKNINKEGDTDGSQDS